MTSHLADDRLSWREMLVAILALALVGAGVYGPYALSAGFAIDDWGHAAAAAHPTNGLLNDYWQQTSNRPVLVLYVPATFLAFGAHPYIHHIWSMLLAVAMAASLFALLRQLSMHPRHAGAIALLALLFPWSDSVRLWATAAHINFAIALALCGILLALHSLELRDVGRLSRARIHHVASLLLYALSILTYEVAGVALLLAGATYLTRAPWSVVRWRWLIDAVVITACLAWTAFRADRPLPTLQEMLTRALDLLDMGATVIARGIEPVGLVDRDLVLIALAGVALSALALSAVRGVSPEIRRALRLWLAVGACGLLIALASWILYIPADSYYRFDAPGVGNRTNALATIGVVVAAYAAIVLLALVVSHRWKNWHRSAALSSIALAAILSLGYLLQVQDDARAWEQASNRSNEVLSSIYASLPNAPAGSTIYTFGHPGGETEGVVVFAFTWDLNGAVKLLYDDPTIRGLPVLAGSTISCEDEGMTQINAAGRVNGTRTHYGDAFFIDVESRGSRRIDSRRSCELAKTHFAPGPEIRYSSGLLR